jgi:hypothetical protein
MTKIVDYVEVSRKANELAAAHGARNAVGYADRLAEEARAEGKSDEHAFWKAVANSLRPR